MRYPDWLALFLFQTDILMVNARFPLVMRNACLASLERAM